MIGPLDDVVVALALRPGGSREVLWEAWLGEPRLLERLLSPPAPPGVRYDRRPMAMSLARAD